LTVIVAGAVPARHALAELAVYVAWINGIVLPQRKKKSAARALKSINLYGHRATDGFAPAQALAEGNVLCRELTVLRRTN